MNVSDAPQPASSQPKVAVVDAGPDIGRLVSGLCFIAAGVVLWLYVRGALELIDIVTYWPLLVIACGLGNLFGRSCRSKGWTLTIIGTFLLLFNLGYAEWPLVLVAVGLVVLVRGVRESRGLRAAGDGHA